MLNLALMLLMVTPAMGSDMELTSFQEICEVTGELKTVTRYSVVNETPEVATNLNTVE